MQITHTKIYAKSVKFDLISITACPKKAHEKYKYRIIAIQIMEKKLT